MGKGPGLITGVESNTNVDYQVNRQIQENIFESFSSTMNSSYISTTTIANNNQDLRIKNVEGCGAEGISVEGVNQSNTTKLNVQQVTSTDNKEQLQEQIEQAIESTLASYQETKGRALITGTEVNVNVAYKNNETVQSVAKKVSQEIINNNIANYNQNLTNNQYLEISDLTTCNVGVGSPGGPINIARISQSNAFDIYAAQVATSATEYLQQYIDTSASTVSLSTTQKTGIALIAVFAVLIIIALIVGIYFGIKKKRTSQQMAAAQTAPAGAPAAAPATPAPSLTASAASLASNPAVQSAAAGALSKGLAYAGKMF